MSLDLQAKFVLDNLPPGTLDVHNVSPQQLREGMKAGSDAAPVVPSGVVEDRQIPRRDGSPMAIRVYRPVDWTDGGGAVVFYHGGGWVIGSLDTHDGTCRHLTNQSGLTVISVDYRLAPEHVYPAGPQDCYDAVIWVAANTEELGIDADRICVAGDSAGGNLAAVTALMCRDLDGPSLAMQLLMYPCTDMDVTRWASMAKNAEGYLLTTSMMEWFYDQYAPSAVRTESYASPIHASDLTGLAPAMVVVAGYDPLCDEGTAYAHALQAAGVPTTLLSYPGLMHGFAGFAGIVDKATEALAIMGTALARATA